MSIIEIILFLLLSVVCVYGSVSDIKTGSLSNKMLLLFSIVGIVLDCFYYTYDKPQAATVFLVNLIITVIISVLLFLFHIWAGGDSKLLITASILYPAGFYFSYKGFRATFVLVIAFSFSLSMYLTELEMMLLIENILGLSYIVS